MGRPPLPRLVEDGRAIARPGDGVAVARAWRSRSRRRRRRARRRARPALLYAALRTRGRRERAQGVARLNGEANLVHARVERGTIRERFVGDAQIVDGI